MRQDGNGHLRVAAPAVGEQRTDRAIDKARRQRILFRRTALALEVAAGNPAGRVIFLGVVDGQRKKIDAFLRLFCRDHGGEYGGLAVGSEYRSVGLAGQPAGL